MKKIMIYLNSMKSRCFMLVTCLVLMASVTSCSEDYFEENIPEKSKQLSKAELIEQALSRAPQTRANGAAIRMVTIKDTVSLRCFATENIVISWGDSSTDTIKKNNFRIHTHTYTDGYPSHSIILNDVAGITIRDLRINNNGLIYLRFINDVNLGYLHCMTNYLDEIDLTTISGLTALDINDNELTSINLSHSSALNYLLADHNQLTAINVSENQNLVTINIANNRVSELDLSQNTKLTYLDASFNPITELDFGENVSLLTVNLEETPITTLNNTPIHKMSFADFLDLRQLNIAYTPFDSLDLSENISLQDVNISGTAITRLDLSNSSIKNLSATRSKLIDLIPGTNLYELRIERTPLEKDNLKMGDLISILPPRTKAEPGHFYSHSSDINNFIIDLASINWLINQ